MLRWVSPLNASMGGGTWLRIVNDFFSTDATACPVLDVVDGIQGLLCNFPLCNYPIFAIIVDDESKRGRASKISNVALVS